MRRVATALGGLAAAGALTLSLSGSAWAAQGTLVVNGRHHSNPHGCYTSVEWPMRVTNATNQSAYIFTAPHCRGVVARVVYKGQSVVADYGTSVSIG